MTTERRSTSHAWIIVTFAAAGSGLMAFTPPPTTDYTLTPRPEGDLLTFPSAFTSPHHENNTVYARYFPARLKPSRY